MNIVYMDGKKEPYTTHDIIAEHAEIDIISVRKLIDKHKKDLEAFGVLSFEIHKPEKGSLGGRPRRIYHLNEQQATLLVTYLGNTEPVREFKKNLVKAFFEMREELTQIRLQRSLEAPKRKTLNEAIKTWEHAPKMAYPTAYNLLLKAVTGKNSKQLKATRGGYSGIDCLNSIELAQYTALEDMAIALINLNFTYQDIKTMALKNTLQCA
ncbi:TPA: Rha family transcriptional regulator [Streptococcus pyogenes]|uniref:Rha family transcriptional regulator n=1 Tax=Streptococcus pyogenes TaxID=1314 RepID=UPI002B09FB86|nr:Rha family transcriptional regulator [Streptococcus pyogenes]HEQ2899340.1 Rha family transcriptional regulator [Streptococcus pyogenes]HER0873733.1 Rha family transcriptional regulator [Streptococcus pyogenes]HER0877379.1 Rha family transcriptional regulator [Streptococcus pyogenes]HER7671065.1 Rha family transcriptional regulator [Streptococcus pyogenes]